MSEQKSLRTGAWTALVTWASVLVAAWAVPVDDVRGLAVEHRQASFDITSNLPSASDDMFVWHGPDGSYRFGMQGLDQWRVESRDASGNVEGRYVYKTPDGQTVDVSYGAGAQGYRARGDAIPGGSAPLEEEPVGKGEPYGALVRAGQETEFPDGNGITTYTDDNAGAVITNVNPEYSSASAVFPVVSIPGSDDVLLGPPLVNEQPLQPAAIPV